MNKKQIIAVGLGGLLLAGAGVGLGFALDQPQTQIVEKPFPVITEKVVEVVKEVPVNVTQIETVTVEDTDFLQKICDRAMYDDITACKEEVNAEDAALSLALEALEDERFVFDLLEDKGVIRDEDEASIIKVYDDFEDINIVKSNFDKDEYKFEVKMKVKDEDRDVKKYVTFAIEVEDGEVDVKLA